MPTDPLHTLLARRRTLAMLAHGALALAAQSARGATPAPRPVVVMTSYPDEVMTRFEAAFERAHPEYRLRILWRMPHDALPWLRQPGQGGVDVYWSASPRTFALLKAEGALRVLDLDRDGLPDRIGRTRLSDPQGHYLATEVAGYGFVLNPSALQRLGVAPPQDWRDLADPRLAGRLALPNPARVGFAPVLVDIVLQAHGWQAGWALWSEIAGLATLVNAGGTQIGDEVASGRAALGLSIDFFVASAIANGAPLAFAYPAHGGINPAHIAITTAAPNPEGARAFADFVLSAAGQRLLAHPDIRKLPVRPAVYEDLPPDYHNPFAAAAQGSYDYDNGAGRERLALIAALFEQMLVQGHATHAELWARVHAAERAGHGMAAVRRLLCAPVLDERAAASPALLDVFRARVERGGNDTGTATPPSTADDAIARLEVEWQWQTAKARSAAARLLDEAGA